jgi:hypothetical protein
LVRAADLGMLSALGRSHVLFEAVGWQFCLAIDQALDDVSAGLGCGAEVSRTFCPPHLQG